MDLLRRNRWSIVHVYIRKPHSSGDSHQAARGRLSHFQQFTAGAIVLVFLAGLLAFESRSSWIEANVLPEIAQDKAFTLEHGPSPALVEPLAGPYDQRLGLSQLALLVYRLKAHGFQVTEQARDSHTARVLSSLGIEPPYQEKDQAGIRILDRQGRLLYRSLYPREIYPSFQSIPPLIVRTLLFIENRQMLDSSHPRRNPAVQWGRLSRAVAGLAIHAVDRNHRLIGGSTLATQLEKMRHWPDGRTETVTDKVRQVIAASLRAYENGPDTLRAQQDIICDYINSIPLAATRDDGEVTGLADGLRDWYGADPASVNRELTADESKLSEKEQAARAVAYRESLSLLLALHAPTRELVRNPEGLQARTDRYLRALADDGIITGKLRTLALRARPRLRPAGEPNASRNFIAYKAPDAIRMGLLPELGINDTYALNRLDLSVRTTLDKPSQDAVTSFLNHLSDPQAVSAAGLGGYQLLDRGQPGSVIYSVTLYVRGKDSNVLRVQTDNYNQPLDINQGTRLQLGSTAKLRTLINYLQIIEQLHGRYAGFAPGQLKQVKVIPGDDLTLWAIAYLSRAGDKSLEPMLRAALNRKYSGSPGEAFFTAGGLHHFENLERSEDGRFFTVADAFQNSVNLAFIRLMRDIEHYYMFRVPGASPSVLSDGNDPARPRYLQRFADYEGRKFLREFYAKYQRQKPEQALETLASSVHLTALRAAVIFRSVRPRAGLPEFAAFLEKHLPESALAHEDIGELYNTYGPDKFDLNDRGYLARVHPLELWLVNYLQYRSNPTLAEVLQRSAAQRQEVYAWLYKTRYKHAQDKRIETLLEMDAFKEIHRAWKQLGYPFDSLTPSYATCIGVSGDTPRALAELAGILLNDGVRLPSARVQQLHFFQGTPFETILAPKAQPGVRLLSPEIAKLVREQMVGVVQNGTGRRASGGIKLPDGSVLPIGGKTGTGDNRLEMFNAHGGLIGSQVQNRTAAFVFFIGDRFYGTILAFVPGENAAGYNFTSALAVQLLKDLESPLTPLAGGAAAPKT